MLRRTRAAYYGLCTALDDCIERLLNALYRLGLADDTLVVYTNDHDEPLCDHELWWKFCMYEPSVGIPLIMRGPDVQEGGVVDRPTSLLDVVSTMVDTLGIEADPEWRGQSLTPVVTGDRDPNLDRTVFSEYYAHGNSVLRIRRNHVFGEDSTCVGCFRDVSGDGEFVSDAHRAGAIKDEPMLLRLRRSGIDFLGDCTTSEVIPRGNATGHGEKVSP